LNQQKLNTMKIKYNNSENTIEIKDGIYEKFLGFKFLLILNVLNAFIRLIVKSKTEYGIIDYFWIAMGLVSLIVLFFFLFKISTAEKIKVSNIKRLNEKSFFGRKRFSLELGNGKNRILGNLKNQSDLAEILELFAKIGIPN